MSNQPLQNESAKAFHAFSAYLSLPPSGRSLFDTAIVLGLKLSPRARRLRKAPTYLQQWSSKFQWVERAKHYDADRQELRLKENHEAVQRMEETHANRASFIQQQLYDLFYQRGVEAMSPSLLRSYFQAAEAERTARGLPKSWHSPKVLSPYLEARTQKKFDGAKSLMASFREDNQRTLKVFEIDDEALYHFNRFNSRKSMHENIWRMEAEGKHELARQEKERWLAYFAHQDKERAEKQAAQAALESTAGSPPSCPSSSASSSPPKPVTPSSISATFACIFLFLFSMFQSARNTQAAPIPIDPPHRSGVQSSLTPSPSIAYLNNSVGLPMFRLPPGMSCRRNASSDQSNGESYHEA